MDIIREAKYTKWFDIYNSDYKPTLERFKNNFEFSFNNETIELATDLYLSALKTLKIYLRNNGFKFK